MSVITSVRYNIKPAMTPIFEQAISEVSERARKQDEPLRWTTAQVVSGREGSYVLALPAESVAAAAAVESAGELLQRLFSAKDAERLIGQFGNTIESSESQILTDRADLSYPLDERNQSIEAVVVTRLIVRPGGREAVEELLRKLAEAIPKTDDVRRFTVYQPIIGDLREIASVRPIVKLAELDQAVPVEELLRQALGVAEGGLVFRSGMEGLEGLTSELLRIRPEMSNPKA